MTQTTAPVEEESPGQPAHRGGGRLAPLLVPWSSRVGLLAALVLGVQLLWRGGILGNGFFAHDDFLLMADAARSSWRDLGSADPVGGFSPGASLVASVQVAVAPLGWSAAVAFVLLVQALAGVLMWLVLSRLLPQRWVRLPLLALFCFTPLTLWSTQWWSVAVQFWPATACLLLAVWAVLRVVQDGERRLLGVALLALVVALLFQERAVLHPVVVLGAAVLASPGATVRARAATALRTLRGYVLGVLVVLVAYGAVRLLVEPVTFGLGSQTGRVVTTYLRHLLAELGGGPWTGTLAGHAFLVPRSWSVALGGALLLAFLGATVQRGGVAARAAAALLVLHGALALGLLVVLGRGDLLASLGLVPRFVADVAPVLVLCAAGALAALHTPALVAGGRQRLEAGETEVVLSCVLTVVLAVWCAASTAFLAPNLYHGEARSYVENLRAALRADPRVVLVDSRVPPLVVDPLFADRARVSEVVGPAPEDPSFGVPSARLRIVTAEGALSTLDLAEQVSAAPGGDPSCPHPVRAEGRWIPLQGALPAGDRVMRLGYYTSTASFARAQTAGDAFTFSVQPGLQVVNVELRGAVGGVHLALEDAGATMCVTNVDVGTPVPPAP